MPQNDTDPDILRKVPPHSTEAEQAILGGILFEPTALDRVRAHLTTDDFYDPKHRLLFETMCKLAKAGKVIDIVTLPDALQDDERLPEVGGAAYIAQLAEYPSAANIDAHATIVQDHSVRRRLIQTTAELQRRCYANEDLETMLGEIERLAAETRPDADPLLRPLSTWQHEQEPPPVIWQQEPNADPPQKCNAVLSVGEVGVLSGPGGVGKSTVVLDVASAAAQAPPERPGTACGLCVRGGPVVLVSYEDAPVRMVGRVKRMTNGKQDILDKLYILDNPAPLFEADPNQRGAVRPGAQWRRLWRAVQKIKPTLVVIDPASAALGGLSLNESGPVRWLLTALREQADRAGCGVLVVAHDTKEARNNVGQGGTPGAGAVAGSATWSDAARGVLYLYREQGDDQSTHRLRCIKANYGRTGWDVALTERFDNAGRFVGLKANNTLEDLQHV